MKQYRQEAGSVTKGGWSVNANNQTDNLSSELSNLVNRRPHRIWQMSYKYCKHNHEGAALYMWQLSQHRHLSEEIWDLHVTLVIAAIF